MEAPARLEIHPAPYPVLEVHRAGFPLDHPYVEQCWAPLLGPSSVLLLRRTSELWRESIPAEVETTDLAAQIGLGRGRGRHSPITKTVERLVRFRFAHWAAPGVLDVFQEVRPVPSRDLSRLPQWSRGRHDQLLTAHLDEIAGRSATTPSPAPAPAVEEPLDEVEAMRRRFNDYADSQLAARPTELGR